MPIEPKVRSLKMRRLIRRLLRLSDDRGRAEGASPAAVAPATAVSAATSSATHLSVDRNLRRLAHEVGRAAAGRPQLKELISFVIARCREVLDAESVAVLLYDRETDELYFPYVAGDPADAKRVMQIRFPADHGIAGAVLRSHQSVRLDDARTDPRFFPGVDQQMEQTTRALLCAPLISPAGVLGVIEAVNLRGAALFTDDDLGLLDALAESLGAAIHNFRTHTPPTEDGRRQSPLPPPLPQAQPEPGGEDREAPAISEQKSAMAFRREGEYWTIQFEGTVSRLKDAKGLHYIAYLLHHPGHEFHVRELVTAVGDASITPEGMDEGQGAGQSLRVSGLGDAGAVLDAKAKAAYKSRLDDLREELEEAERFNDPGRATRAREEIDFITNQLAAAVGLGGRDRTAVSDAERARLAVTKRIKAALAKIRQANPALAHHLNAAITTGYFCSYAPKAHTATDWSLE